MEAILEKTGDLVTYDKENGMHKKIFYSFIDDKNHNKKLLVIRTKGTIAGQYRVYSEEGANKVWLEAWPSAFKVQLQLPDNEVAQISDYYPRNSIDTKEYMSTLTYGSTVTLLVMIQEKLAALLVQMFRLVIH